MPVIGLTNAVAIAAGAAHSCALLASGTAWCWGFNDDGQLGDGTQTDRLAPVSVSVSGLTNAVAIAAGQSHTCALIANGNARCWGDNTRGQLGDGTTTQRLTPVPVILENAVGIAAGADHTCALLGNGSARCWGHNIHGEIGDGTSGPDIHRSTPVLVSDLANAVAISAGGRHSCALLANGTAWCWGANDVGQLGDGTGGLDIRRLTPVLVSGLINAVAIAAGGAHSCALLANGSGVCWGSNVAGALGNGTGPFSDSSTPTPVHGGGGSVTGRDIAAGSSHTCAVRANSTVSCWGSNSQGQLGDGTATDRLTPVAVSGLTDATAIAAGENHTCALLASGSARCWGENGSGQLGDGTSTVRPAPVPVSGLPVAVRSVRHLFGQDRFGVLVARARPLARAAREFIRLIDPEFPASLPAERHGNVESSRASAPRAATPW